MSWRRLGRVFCLSAITAFTLVGTGAGVAQGAEFWVGKEGSFLLATLTGKQSGIGQLVVPGRNSIINCQTGVTTSGELEFWSESKGVAEFKECTVLNFATGAELKTCSVSEPISATFRMKPANHGLTEYVRFDAYLGTLEYTKIVLWGIECAVKGTYSVKGVISAEVTQNGQVVNAAKASKAFSELVSDSLSFGAFSANINAAGSLELTGAHAGVKFGVA